MSSPDSTRTSSWLSAGTTHAQHVTAGNPSCRSSILRVSLREVSGIGLRSNEMLDQRGGSICKRVASSEAGPIKSTAVGALGPTVDGQAISAGHSSLGSSASSITSSRPQHDSVRLASPTERQEHHASQVSNVCLMRLTSRR